LIILAACAFARTVDYLLADKRLRVAIETAESFADGLATPQDMLAVAVALSQDDSAAAWAAATGAAWAEEEPFGDLVAAWAKEAASSAQLAAKQTASNPEIAEATHLSILNCLLPPRIQFAFPAHVQGLASQIYHKRDWPLMPILADALEEIGQAEMAVHCRQPIHAKGCHLLDSILGLR
jgi:hypothetical protein